MRISLRDKNMSFKAFEKMFKGFYAGMHETVREKAIIADYEKATGKKHADVKRVSKKSKSSDKESSEDKK